MSINQRVEELENFYKKKGISAVYKQIGIAPSSWSGMKIDGANLKLANLFKIFEYAEEINPLWLLLGEGPMLKSELGQIVKEPNERYQVSASTQMSAWMESVEDKIRALETEVAKLKGKKKD